MVAWSREGTAARSRSDPAWRRGSAQPAVRANGRISNLNRLPAGPGLTQAVSGGGRTGHGCFPQRRGFRLLEKFGLPYSTGGSGAHGLLSRDRLGKSLPKQCRLHETSLRPFLTKGQFDGWASLLSRVPLLQRTHRALRCQHRGGGLGLAKTLGFCWAKKGRALPRGRIWGDPPNPPLQGPPRTRLFFKEKPGKKKKSPQFFLPPPTKVFKKLTKMGLFCC